MSSMNAENNGNQFHVDMSKDGNVVAELQAKLEHAQRMLQQVDATGDRHTGKKTKSVRFLLLRLFFIF